MALRSQVRWLPLSRREGFDRSDALVEAGTKTMFKGTVTFCARIKGNGLTFPLVEFNPHEPGIDKVESEAVDGEVIRSTVHLAVQSCEAGIGLATKVNTTALNRLAFSETIAIENARVEREDFSSLDDQPGAHVLVAGTGRYSLIGGAVKFVVGRSPNGSKRSWSKQRF